MCACNNHSSSCLLNSRHIRRLFTFVASTLHMRETHAEIMSNWMKIVPSQNKHIWYAYISKNKKEKFMHQSNFLITINSHCMYNAMGCARSVFKSSLSLTLNSFDPEYTSSYECYKASQRAWELRSCEEWKLRKSFDSLTSALFRRYSICVLA